MVAAAGRVDLRRPAELAEGQHDRGLEHPPPPEVFQQRGIGVVEVGADLVLVALDRAERRRAVDVPGDLVEHGLEHIHGDEPDAALDQPAGQQAALAEPGAAVPVAERGRLGGEVERLARLGAGHHPEGAFEVGVEQPGVGRRLERADGPVDRRAERPPARLAHRRDVIRRQQVGDLERLVIGIGIEDERVIRLAEVSGGVSVRQVAAGRADRLGQHDIRRRVVPRPLELGHHRAIRRMLGPAGEQPAGLHHLVPGVVDGRRRVVHRADQRDLVHHRRQPGEDLRDLDARHLGGDRSERPADLLGRSGFMSQVSSCDGPPTRNSRMQLISRSFATAPEAAIACIAGSPRPRAVSDPAWRKSRRVRPSQKWTGFLASIGTWCDPSNQMDRKAGVAGRKSRASAKHPS